MERRSLLRSLAFATLTFGVVGGAVILRWQALNRVPNGIDIAIYLVALPLGLLLGFLLLRHLIDSVRKHGQKNATSLAEESIEPVTPADPTRDWQLSIFAAATLFAGGDTPAALIETSRTNQRAGLHPTLHDNHGLPVFAAAVDGIDIASIEDNLPDAAQAWGESRKRTLLLAQTLASRMLDEQSEWLRPTAPADGQPRAQAANTPVLQLEWLLPACWGDSDRELAQAWLTSELAAQGWREPALQIISRGVPSGTAALKRLDDLNRAFQQERSRLPHLLLASESHLDEPTLTEWNAARELHGAGRPEGRVPGEGASALLLAAAHPTAMPEIACLQRVLAGRRTEPVDKPGRLQADTFSELVGKALEQARLESDALAYLVSDTDMRASRSAEAMHLAERILPERDPTEALLPLGLANGECGAALALATVAVAAQLAADTQQPGLILSHHDASLRVVAVVVPPSPAAATRTTPSLT